VERTIQIRKYNRIKLPDAIIAATALQNDLILVTNNATDFKNIKDLEIFNPYGKS
jgi:predicted nucleic acid-binding protein